MAEAAIGPLSYPGDYTFNYVKLFSFRHPLEIDITGLFASMELYESVGSPFLTMKMTIIDGSGIMSTTRMIGEEFLEVDCRNPAGDSGLKAKQFFIYKITDRTLIGDKSVAYTMHCISLEALADINTKIPRAFTGQPSDIAKTILTEYLGTQLPMVIEPTKNSLSYVSNYWSPARNLKFLADRSVSKETNAPAYVFFETKQAYMFTSLNSLKEAPSVSSFYYSFNTHDPDVPEQRYGVIENLYIDENFDYIKRISTGAMGSRSLMVNPITKSYTYGYYDLIQSFEEFARLNEEPFTTSDAPRRLNSFFQYRVAPTSAFTNMQNDHPKDWYIKRVTETASLGAQSIQIDVIGKFNIYAGNIVDLYIYSEPADDSTDMYAALDSILSGRWMVMSICHHIDKQRHSMSLELNKDSLFKYKPLATPQNTNTPATTTGT